MSNPVLAKGSPWVYSTAFSQKMVVNADAIDALNLHTTCDFTLGAGERVVLANSVGLARISGYFKAMLSNNFKEKRVKKAEFSSVEYHDLVALFNFSLNGFVRHHSFNELADFFCVDNFVVSKRSILNFCDRLFRHGCALNDDVISQLRQHLFCSTTQRNLLLYGDPGTGKSVFSEALKNVMGYRVDDFYYLELSNVYLRGFSHGQKIFYKSRSEMEGKKVVVLDQLEYFPELDTFGSDVVARIMHTYVCDLLCMLEDLKNKRFLS